MRSVPGPVANHWLRASVSMIAVSARSIACSVGRPRRVMTAHVVGAWATIFIFLARGTGAACTSSTAIESNRDLPQTRCFSLLQEWPLCIKTGGSLVVATHIFYQTKQRRSARQVHVALHARLNDAARASNSVLI